MAWNSFAVRVLRDLVIEIVPTRMYGAEEARAFLAGVGLDVETILPHVQDRFMSAFIRARKPKMTK